MLQLQPLDPKTPIFQQLNTAASPVVLVNIFHVAEGRYPCPPQSMGGGRQLDEAPTRLYLDAITSRDRWQHRVHELRPVGVSSPLSGGIFPL
jgi:hypothetical protein